MIQIQFLIKSPSLSIPVAALLFSLGGSLLMAAPINPNNIEETFIEGTFSDKAYDSVLVPDSQKLYFSVERYKLPFTSNNGASITMTAYYYRLYDPYSNADNPSNKSRPITFIYNGGPGASSAITHTNFGPLKYDIESTELVNNPDTLLTHSDLLFIDPVATGTSTIDVADGINLNDEFAAFYDYNTFDYETDGYRDYQEAIKNVYGHDGFSMEDDSEDFYTFITAFMRQKNLRESEIFLMGESWGGVRNTNLMTTFIKKGKMLKNLKGAIFLSGSVYKDDRRRFPVSESKLTPRLSYL